MKEDWRNECRRLWHPPLDALTLFLRNIETDGGKGGVIGPHEPTETMFNRLQDFTSRLTVLMPSDSDPPLLEGMCSRSERWEVVEAELRYPSSGRGEFRLSS